VTVAATVGRSPAASASPERASLFTARCTTTTCRAKASQCQGAVQQGLTK